jgi:hypothetical protein
MDARTTHASLIARLADRADEAAWREFGERYGSLLRGFALRRGLSGPEVGRVRVVDSGLARASEVGLSVAAMRSGMFVGSLPWASPEHAAG